MFKKIMPVNVSPEYVKAEKKHLESKTLEEKIETLRRMISLAPNHKGGENLRAQLKTRYKSLTEKLEKKKKTSKSHADWRGIKKEDMQTVLIGFSGSGKSTLISKLANTSPEYIKNKPVIKMMPYLDIQIQLVKNPSVDSGYYDKGVTNGTDTILIVVERIEDIEKIQEKILGTEGKKIIVFNKIDLLSEGEIRKIHSYLQSKKYNFIMITSLQDNFSWGGSSELVGGTNLLKQKIFSSFDKIRIYTKEPGREKSQKPIIMNPGSTVEEASEKILKGFSKKVVETKIWGPSSKFGGQIVGLKHELKDLDVVEFKTK